VTVHSSMLDVHESWVDLPGKVRTTAAWRYFNLRYWVDADSYEVLLRYLSRDDSIAASQVLDVLSLAAEAVTRSGLGARRCTSSDVRWARRTGLALFGAALRTTNGIQLRNAEGAARLLLPYLSDGEREVARLALPREGSHDHRIASKLRHSLLSKVSNDKIDRLLGLCRLRVVHATSAERSS
jgi:hypothetical protein